MIVDESELRKLIREEINSILSEGDAEGEDLNEGRFEKFTIGLAIGLLGALGVMERDHDSKVSARIEARAELASQQLSSKDRHTRDMAGQLRNAAAHYWAVDPDSPNPYPIHQFENVEQLKGKRFQVLPPEYVVYSLVLADKKAGNPRFGIPETPEEKERLIANIKRLQGQTDNKAIEAEASNFFKKFSSPKQFIQVSKITPGLQSFGDPTLQAIVPTKEAVFSVYANSPMPQRGMTAKDYYNAVYWGQHMTTEDYDLIATQSEFDPDKEINPELVRRTAAHAAKISKNN
tara:strand:+ start:318 stop:1187 length:870 start_codon:yes stop_codon:yes gene_type:complete